LRAAIVVVCLCFGVIPLWLLNGQTLTNSLIALPFFLVSIVLCVASALDRRTPEDQKRAWRLSTILMALLAVGVILTLRSACRFQEGFNNARMTIHQARTNRPTEARPQAAAQENRPGKARDDALQQLRPKVRVGKVPVVTLGPRKPSTREQADRIKTLIARLASIDQADYGLSPTMSGYAFLPISSQRDSGAMILTDHQLHSSAALQALVELGPDALPFLLDALADKTPTKFKIEHVGGIGGIWLDNELWGNPANELEMRTRGRRRGIAERFKLGAFIDSYTVKIGDVCLVAIGQIVGRGYQAVRYQPTACIVINSPVEDAKFREQVRKIWSSDDPVRKLVDSLLLDYATEGVPQGSSSDGWSISSALQTHAALRLLYYFPKETAALISERLRSLDVRRTAAHGKGSPATDEELDAHSRREAANRVRTDDFVKAVSWCREPEVQNAIRDIFAKTTDIDILLAALPGIEDTDRALIRDRLQAFLDAVPAQEGGAYGDGYHMLEALADRLGQDAVPAFDRYLKGASAQRGHSAAEVLARGTSRGEWCSAILSRLLDDRRPVGGYTYAVHRDDQNTRLEIRVCDVAAEALHRHRPELNFTLEGRHEDLDRQIRTIRDQLAATRR
jgi:hypothetical protein